jgi:hypothetical protein
MPYGNGNSDQLERCMVVGSGSGNGRYRHCRGDVRYLIALGTNLRVERPPQLAASFISIVGQRPIRMRSLKRIAPLRGI